MSAIGFGTLTIEDPGPLAEMTIEALRGGAAYELRGVGLDVDVMAEGAEPPRWRLDANVVRVECPERFDFCEVTVKWDLFDDANGFVSYHAVTSGSHDIGDSSHLQASWHAFEVAARRLGGRERLSEVLAWPTPDFDTGPTWVGTIDIARCGDATLPFPDGVEQALDAVLLVTTDEGVGSGVVISPDGFAFTAAHVVAGHEMVTVTTPTGLAVSARVLRTDRFQDVALIDLAGSGYRCLRASSAPAGVGADIWAIGSPMGKGLAFSVSRGVNAGWRDFQGSRFIQVDASINPGNSGGPLLDQLGTVQGVVSFKIVAPGFEGLGFGVPTDVLLRRLELSFADSSTQDAMHAGGKRGDIVKPKLSTVWDTTDETRVHEEIVRRRRRGALIGSGVTIGVLGGMGAGASAATAPTATTMSEYRSYVAANTLSWTLVGVGAALTIGGSF